MPLLLAGLSLGSVGLCGFFRMTSIFNAGQQLSEKVSETRRILSKWRVTHKVDKSMKKEIEFLIAELNEAVPIRPHGAYNVDNSSALSTYGIAITYVIVLLQFKTSE